MLVPDGVEDVRQRLRSILEAMDKRKFSPDESRLIVAHFVKNATIEARAHDDAGTLFTLTESIHVAAGWLVALCEEGTRWVDGRQPVELFRDICGDYIFIRGQALSPHADRAAVWRAVLRTLG